MDDERRKTILTLVDLAEDGDPVDCWDERRAENLLRTQSSPEELRELEVDPAVIRRLWPEQS